MVARDVGRADRDCGELIVERQVLMKRTHVIVILAFTGIAAALGFLVVRKIVVMMNFLNFCLGR